MKKISPLYCLIIALLLLSHKTVQGQYYPGTKYHVYRNAEDFFNNKYLEADHTTNSKYFRKDKIDVIEKKSSWGVSVEDYKDVGFPIVYREDVNRSFLIVECGTICLYLYGYYIYDTKGNANIVYQSHSIPYMFSVGLDGPILSTTKKNLESAMQDDKLAIERIESSISNVVRNYPEFVASREEIVRFYNKRHPSGKTEWDFKAISDSNTKKKH